MLNGGTFALKHLSDVKRAMTDTVDETHFAFDPFIVVGSGARATGMEQLMAIAAADVDGDGQVFCDGVFDELRAKFPGGVFVEMGELEFFFLFQELD